MKSYVRRVSFFLFLLLIFNFSAVFADNFTDSKNDIVTNTVLNYEDYEEITPYVVSEVIIFIAGIVAGYIIDGVVIVATGQSTGEWVARALTFHKKNPNVEKIYFETPDGYPHSGSGGTFSF